MIRERSMADNRDQKTREPTHGPPTRTMISENQSALLQLKPAVCSIVWWKMGLMKPMKPF